MQPELRIPALHLAKQIFVPFQRNVGIVSALQQQLPAAKRNGLFNLLEDLVEPQRVAFRRPHRPVKRAELAARHTDVGVVDVAVDDVRHHPFRMPARTRLIRKPTKQGCGRVKVKLQRLVASQPPARTQFVSNGRYSHHKAFSNATSTAPPVASPTHGGVTRPSSPASRS